MTDRKFNVNPMRHSADKSLGVSRADGRCGFARAAIDVNDMNHEWTMNDREHHRGISCVDVVHDINVIHEHECKELNAPAKRYVIYAVVTLLMARRAQPALRVLCAESTLDWAGLETLFTT
jgi:hypothetical protein